MRRPEGAIVVHHPAAFGFVVVVVLAFASIGSFAPSASARDAIPLTGAWRFELDPADQGVADRWSDRPLTGRVRLPGSLAVQRIGNPVSTNTRWTGSIADRSWFTDPEYERYRVPGEIRVPFWLQPETVYIGAAWYQRDVLIPPDWEDRRVVLFLERPHWETRVWVDDQLIGAADTLGTPHEHDLGLLNPGRHRLTIRVDNRMIVDIGENSHAISDHTQGNWNGIVGRIELRSTPLVWIDEVQVIPDLRSRSARVHWRLGNATGLRTTAEITCSARLAEAPTRLVTQRTTDHAISPGGGGGEIELFLGEQARTWDEFDPRLYAITVESRTVDGQIHQIEVPFGLREFAADGTGFTVNGRPVFLRGTLECSIFPRTGHPPVDVESWRRVLRTAQAHGLNHLRFHSHCPPEAAFIAADELGMYLQVEASSWANQSTTLGDGRPVDAWIYAETERILRHFGNHPSFVLMASGNEPAGARHRDFLAQWVAQFKARDPRRLWTSAAGWPELPANQWHSIPDPRIQAWGAGLKSRINSTPPETTTDYRAIVAARTVPVVAHEIGQWCAYPDFSGMRKYTGHLKPRNFEIFRDTLNDHGLGHLARRFLAASGRLQTLCYKEEIESALRTQGLAGFQLLDLHDFPGQGTAPVGVLDPFWDGKGYVTPAEFRRFCGPTIPLARLTKRVFTQSESLEADVDVSHFGPVPLLGRKASWALVDEIGRAVAEGTLPGISIPVGLVTRLGRVEIALSETPAPAKYRLVVTVATRPPIRNDWDVWVYPTEVPSESSTPSGPGTDTDPVQVVSDLDAAALETLSQGGRVLWLIPPSRVRPDPETGPVALGFSPIFWNTAWTARQAPHTLGILCDPRNPALDRFPTEFHSNWQWWSVVRNASPMILDSLPKGLDPTIRVIDDWVTARSLALAFEARVGPGRLFVCSVDLSSESDLDPVRRQLRSSLMEYLRGPRFRPRISVTPEQLRSLVAP
ncbi:MAG: sugar-binding domain-containing protein [Limisphaerales bacterium]